MKRINRSWEHLSDAAWAVWQEWTSQYLPTVLRVAVAIFFGTNAAFALI